MAVLDARWAPVLSLLHDAKAQVDSVLASADAAYLECDPSERGPPAEFRARYFLAARVHIDISLAAYGNVKADVEQTMRNSEDVKPQAMEIMLAAADIMAARDYIDREVARGIGPPSKAEMDAAAAGRRFGPLGGVLSTRREDY